MPWAGHYSLDTNWPNCNDGPNGEGHTPDWMMDVFQNFLPDFDWDRFVEWVALVENSEDPRQLLRAPLCTADVPHPKPPVSCTVGDDFVRVAEAAPVPAVAEPVVIQFGTLEPMVIEAEALTPMTDSKGRKVKPHPTIQFAEKLSKTLKSTKRVNTDPRTWTPPTDPEKLRTWKKFQKRMIARFDKQEE